MVLYILVSINVIFLLMYSSMLEVKVSKKEQYKEINGPFN